MKKSTKRITAILIALVMLIGCSVGIISASAAPGYEQSKVDELMAAMKKYEDKMDGKIYTNMAAAYEAYVQLSKVLDRYYYGNQSVEPVVFNNAINGMDTALNNMQLWGGFPAVTASNMAAADYLFGGSGSANGSGSDGDSSQWSAISSNFTNLLWAEKGYDTTTVIRSIVEGTNQQAIRYRLFYPIQVLVYDGQNTPKYGVLVEADCEYSGNGANASRYVFAIAVNNNNRNQGSSLSRNWTTNCTTGQSFSRDFAWNLLNAGKSISYSGATLTAGNTSLQVKNGRPIIGAQSWQKSLANMVNFTGTMGDTEFVRELYPTFTTYTGSTDNPSTASTAWNNDIVLTLPNGSAPIYVLNIKGLNKAITDFCSSLSGIANYREGGLSAAMAALDQATAYNYNTDFASVQASQASISAKMSEVNTKFTSWATAMTISDSQKDQYNGLRAAIDDARALYYHTDADTSTANGVNPTVTNENGTSNPKYCPKPWETFADLFAQIADQGNTTRRTSGDAFMRYAGFHGDYTNGTQAADYAKQLNDAFAAVKEHQQAEGDTKIKVPEEGSYKKATCDDPGLGVEYTNCTNTACNTEFIVDNAKVIDAADHTYVFTPAEDYDCITGGTPAYYQCVREATETVAAGCGHYFDYYDGEPGIDLGTEPPGPEAGDGHDLKLLHEAVEATCQASGYKHTIYHCTECGKYFTDSDPMTTDEISPEEATNDVDPVKPHNYGELQPAVEATCQQVGNDAYYVCDMCNHYFTTEEDASQRQDLGVNMPARPQLAHLFTNYEYDEESQAEDECVTPGTKTAYCDYQCGETETILDPEHPAIGHKFEEDGAEHPAVLPTCRETGTRLYYTCDNCHKDYALNSPDQIVSLNPEDLVIAPTYYHTLIEHGSRNATCLEAGYDTYYECSTCNDLFESNAQVPADEATDETLEAFDENKIDSLSDWDNYYATGIHTLIRHSERTATCLTKGYSTYYECALCNRLFDSDAQGSVEDLAQFESDHEITNFDGDGDDAWSKLGTHSVKHFEGTVANCVEGGEEDHYECIYCDKWFSDDSGEEDKIISEVQPTEIDPNNHIGYWTYHEASDPSCTKEWWTTSCWECLGCGNFYGDKNQATTDDALDQDIMNEPVEHNENGTREDAIVIQDSTCYYEGSQIRYKYCTICGDNQSFTTESIAMKPHTPNYVEKQPPTCQAEGLEAHYECSVPECGKLFAVEDTTCEGNPITRDSIKIDSVGHNFTIEGNVVTDATCNTNAIVTYECSYECGTTADLEKASTMTGHNMTTHAQKEASCLEDGVPETYYSCDICSTNYTDDSLYTTNVYSGYLSTPATGHSFVLGDAGTVPTCEAEGSKAYYVCENSNCDLEDAKFLTNTNIKATEGIKDDNELYLPKDPDNHTKLGNVAATPASCQPWQDGVKAHIYCDGCKNYYQTYDHWGEEPVENPDEVFKIPASHTLTHYDGNPVSCLEDGWVEVYVCDVCGEYFKDNTPEVEKSGLTEADVVIYADGHNFGAYVPAVEATCVVEGSEGYYGCSECNIKVICAEEDKEEHDILFYDGDDSDDIDLGLDENNHKNIVGVLATPATCTDDGILAHVKCNDCGKEFVDATLAEEADEDNIKDPATGHSFTDYKTLTPANCTDDEVQIAYCDNNCGETDTKTIAGSATGHNYESVVTKEATCGTDGERTYTCKNCDDSYTEPITATGEHSYVGEITLEPTATEPGTMTITCTVCGHTFTISIAPNGLVELAILAGENLTYVIDSNDEKTIVCTGNFEKFVELQLEGEKVDEANYTLKHGSTIIIFNTDFLNSLEVGTYKATLVYTYGSIDTTLTIVDKVAVAPSDPSEDDATTTKPSGETTKPSDETTKPGDETSKPSDETTKPSDETTKPSDETTKPSDETTKPTDETTKPSDETTKPGDEAIKPSDETTEAPDKAPADKPSEAPGEESTEAPGEAPVETPSEEAEDAPSKAPSNDNQSNGNQNSGSNGSSNNSGKSPSTGLVITIPVFSLAALAGGFFSLGYARKKKNEEEE